VLQYQQHQQQQGRQPVACDAFLDFLRGGGSKGGSSSSSKLVEKPLYNKRDMFNLGGLEVRMAALAETESQGVGGIRQQ
jgi:hypothetical protein